jgi:hypothetical protein
MAQLTIKSGNVDVRDWSFEALDEFADALQPLIARAVADTLQIGIEKSVVTYGSRSKDPLTVSMHMDLSDTGVIVEFDARKDIKRSIEWMRLGEDAGFEATKLRNLMVAFREMADEIEAALQK